MSATKQKKAPKVNVEKRRAEYEKFISTRDEEYDLWKDLAVQKSFLKELTTTTYDITENYERFFDKLFAFCQAFKIKMKTKEFKYEFFRSFFFGGVGVRKDDSTDVEKNYDGLTRYIVKEDNDAALKARRGFLDIYMALEEVNDLNEENFPDSKKKMKEVLTAFIKHYEAHCKKHHKPIHEILADFLKVLRNVLTSNFYYSLFEFEHQDPAVRKVNDFKDAALLEKLCTDLQEAFRILMMTNCIKDNPSLVVLTNKFKIPKWEDNKIQKHFIKPLYERWVSLRKEMNRLYAFGEDHWVVPIGENIDMVKLINELIEQELISEKILGSDLKRDQLNFLFNTIVYIYNSPAKEKLLADGTESEIIIEHVIPKLTVLRYLDHIVRITKAKRSDVLKQERMQEYLTDFRSQPEQEENKDQDLKMMAATGEYKSRDIKVPYITALDEEDTPEDLDKFGRYWVWTDYFPETMKDEILRAAENLRNINVAVRQDLADDYVSTALKVQPSLQKGGRSEVMKRKKEKNETVVPADLVRPPHIWNHTDVIEEEHQYRGNARPYDIYAGARVKDMNSQIESLAYELRSFTGDRWNELVKEVIGFFKANSTEEQKEILDVKLPQTF